MARAPVTGFMISTSTIGGMAMVSVPRSSISEVLCGMIRGETSSYMPSNLHFLGILKIL